MRQFKNDKESRLVSLRVTSILVVIMFSFMFVIPTPTLEQQTDTRQWHVVWRGTFSDLALAEADPGSNKAGILEVFFVNHTDTPNSTYFTNNSGLLENWCTAAHLGYSSANAFDTEIAALINFDIVVRVRGNKSVCGNGTGAYSIFRADWLRINITATTPLDLADQWTYGIATRNVSTDSYVYVNFYLNDTFPSTGTFTLDKDNSATISEIRLDAFY